MAVTKCKSCGMILENERILENHYRKVHAKAENLSNDNVED